MNYPLNQTGKKIQNYIFNYSDFLGAGNFSKCYKGINELTNQIVAIKIVELNSLKSKKLQQLLFQQIQILKKLNHPSVLKCFEIFTSNRNCYIITELCNQGNLENKLKLKGRFQQQQANPIINDVYNGLLYLSQQNIVHRDFKSANIFLNNGHAKIADFGFAKEISHNFKDFNIGSPLYMAPQGILHNIYGPKTQVWALGILVYQLFHGTTPYNHCKTEEQLKKSVMMPLHWNQLRPDLSQDVKQFILTCLQVNEQKRLTMEQLINLNYLRRCRQSSDIYNSKYEGKSPSKSMHISKPLNDGRKEPVERVNNFKQANNVMTRDNSDNKMNPRQYMFRSVDTKNHQNMNFSSPKKGLIPSNIPLNSPTKNFNMNSAYLNKNLHSYQSTNLGPRENLVPQRNSQRKMTYQNYSNNQNLIQYPQQQVRPVSNIQTLNNNFLDNGGYGTFTNGFANNSNPMENSENLSPLNMHSQKVPPFQGFPQNTKPTTTTQSRIESNILLSKITFKQAIFFIHHCRVVFKFLCMYKLSQIWNEQVYLKIYKYLITILVELRNAVESGKVKIDGDKVSVKMNKLKEVTAQYLQKYVKQLQLYNYHIQPQVSPQTMLSYIRSLFLQQIHYPLSKQLQASSNKMYITESDQSLLILGHLVVIIIVSINQIEKSVEKRDYTPLGGFKQIQNVLNTSKEEFTYENYVRFKERWLEN